ncbi:MAG: hypothetical protein EHM61_27480 [Acidobacteria bacterium]|nr:MAG: hypothetical protein EHM61_27480 [Acidobacteriota bacterium]
MKSIRTGLLASVVLWSLAVTAPAQEQKSQEPRFRAQAYAGLLEVRVTAPDGKPVAGLTQEDFEVREGGKQRKIVLFRTERSVPLTLGILIDTGPTVSEEYVFKARDMVFELIHLLDREDEMMLVAFDEEAHFLTGPTSDRKELVDGLWNIATARKKKSFLRDLLNGSTSRTGLAIDFTLLELKKARHETKAILVISAGFGGIGLGTLDHLQMAGARFFAISFPNKAGDVLGLGGDQMARKKVVEETGGISYSVAEVAGKIQVLRDGLKNVYLLAYESGETEEPGRVGLSVIKHAEYRVHFAPRVSSSDSFY